MNRTAQPEDPADQKKTGTPDGIDPVGRTTAVSSSALWPAEEQLIETTAVRNPFRTASGSAVATANTLAKSRQTIRLLWIALLVALVAHIVVPAYLVTAMSRPEKVALMDGTETLLIAPLVPVEQNREILETISYWAAKSFLDRGPQGFDALDTLDRVFLPKAAEKAKDDFKAVADEFAKKNIHQKLEIGRIDLQPLGDGSVISHVLGQVLAQGQVGDEHIDEPQPIALDLKLVRNPYLGRNKRYPFAVTDYSFGKPPNLTVLKRDEK